METSPRASSVMARPQPAASAHEGWNLPLNTQVSILHFVDSYYIYGTFQARFGKNDRSFQRLAQVTWLSRTRSIVFAQTLVSKPLSKTPTEFSIEYAWLDGGVEPREAARRVARARAPHHRAAAAVRVGVARALAQRARRLPALELDLREVSHGRERRSVPERELRHEHGAVHVRPPAPVLRAHRLHRPAQVRAQPAGPRRLVVFQSGDARNRAAAAAAPRERPHLGRRARLWQCDRAADRAEPVRRRVLGLLAVAALVHDHAAVSARGLCGLSFLTKSIYGLVSGIPDKGLWTVPTDSSTVTCQYRTLSIVLAPDSISTTLKTPTDKSLVALRVASAPRSAPPPHAPQVPFCGAKVAQAGVERSTTYGASSSSSSAGAGAATGSTLRCGAGAGGGAPADGAAELYATTDSACCFSLLHKFQQKNKKKEKTFPYKKDEARNTFENTFETPL